MMMNAGLAEISRLTGFGLGGDKFDAVAIGTSATAPAASQTALGAEISTGGGQRKTGGDVTATLQTTSSADDTIRFVVVWAFTNTFGINEFGVFNDASAGDMLLRQTFASQLNVVAADTLELTIDVIASDDVVSANSVITFAGLEEGMRLIATDLTPASGRLAAIALGQSAAGLAQSNTALGDEIVAADGFGLGRGEETAGPTVALATTNVANDTVRITSTWAVTGTVGVNETGSFTSTSPSSGILFVRYVFAAQLNLVNTDTFTMIMDLVQVP